MLHLILIIVVCIICLHDFRKTLSNVEAYVNSGTTLQCIVAFIDLAFTICVFYYIFIHLQGLSR